MQLVPVLWLPVSTSPLALHYPPTPPIAAAGPQASAATRPTHARDVMISKYSVFLMRYTG